MGKILFKNDEIEFSYLDQESMFSCAYCGQMGHEIPVRSKNSKKQLKTYHAHCADAVIYKIKHEPVDKRINESLSNIKVSPAPALPIDEILPASKIKPKKSYLIPVEDEELERKKRKLNAVLNDELPEEIAKEKEEVKEKTEAKPKAKIEITDDGVITLIHKYDQRVIPKYHFIKQIKFNRGLKRWECNIGDADYETCRFFFKIFKEIPQFDWLISDEAIKAIKKKTQAHEKLMRESKEVRELKSKKDIDIDLSHMKMEPYPYQKVGIAFLNKVNGVGMIGDSMGIGKSLQAIGYTSYNKLHTVIVCPASLKYNWQLEIDKFTDRTSVVLTEFDPSTLSHKNKLADYVIINYDQLDKYQNYLAKHKFDCVVLDESQYIMNLQSKRTKSVFKYFKKIPHRVCLSGTPIKNKPIEFYAQLKFLRSDLFSNKMKYALRYCDAKENGFGWDLSGSSNLDELNRKIAPFYIRRLKSEVLKDLPEKTVSVLDIDMGVTEKNEYKKIQREFNRLMSDNLKIHGKTYSDKKLDGHHLAKLMELKQFCSKMKVKRVEEFVKEFLNSSEDRKIIVFSQFIETQKALKAAFPGISVSLLGEDSDIKRAEAVKRFQEDPNIRVFVGSTLAAGVGITLTEADTVVFADLMWSPSDHEQAADRIHRIGQKNACFVYYMIFKDSIEEMIWKVVGNKLSIITQILDGKGIKEVQPDVIKKVFQDMLSEFRKTRSEVEVD